MADEALLAAWRKAARDIADQAAQIGTEKSYRRAYVFLVAIRDILAQLDEYTRQYLEQVIDEVYRQADTKTSRTLALKMPDADVNDVFGTLNEQAIRFVVDQTTAKLSAATSGVAAKAEEFFRHARLKATLDEAIAKNLPVSASRQALAAGAIDALLKQWQQGIIEITTTGGQLYHYDGDYYASIVSQGARGLAVSTAVIARTAQNAMDLVMVSPNFSTVQDWCDAVRGRIYSLSGTDPVAPPLAALPNGGPPLHVNCYHVLLPWIRDFEGEAQYEARSFTDPRFLNVDTETARKVWNRLGVIEQARLRHAPDKATERAAMVA